jgi:hypothetical protein
MAGKPARSGERVRPGEDERPDEPTTPRQSTPTVAGQSIEDVERTGPIVAARLHKADGRALILYSTAGERT